MDLKNSICSLHFGDVIIIYFHFRFLKILDLFCQNKNYIFFVLDLETSITSFWTCFLLFVAFWTWKRQFTSFWTCFVAFWTWKRQFTSFWTCFVAFWTWKRQFTSFWTCFPLFVAFWTWKRQFTSFWTCNGHFCFILDLENFFVRCVLILENFSKIKTQRTNFFSKSKMKQKWPLQVQNDVNWRFQNQNATKKWKTSSKRCNWRFQVQNDAFVRNFLPEPIWNLRDKFFCQNRF